MLEGQTPSERLNYDKKTPVDWSITALADKLDDVWDMQEMLDSQLYSEPGWNKENGMIDSTRFDTPLKSAPQILWNENTDDLPEEKYSVCGVCKTAQLTQFTDTCSVCGMLKCMGCDKWTMSTQVTVENKTKPVCLSCLHK